MSAPDWQPDGDESPQDVEAAWLASQSDHESREVAA